MNSMIDVQKNLYTVKKTTHFFMNILFPPKVKLEYTYRSGGVGLTVNNMFTLLLNRQNVNKNMHVI